MLILTRKPDQSIVVGDNIVIQVLESRGNQIRLGITAPLDVSIHRQEIYERIHGKLPTVLDDTQDSEAEAV